MLVRVGDNDLYFDVGGPELVAEGGRMVRRPVIVALHGGPGFDHGYLKPALAPMGEWAQVVFLDLPGQGRSQQAGAAPLTLDAMADGVAAFCAAVGLERPVILGHSVGGHVALTLALRHPRQVGGLVLVNAAARFDLAASLTLLAQRAGPLARDTAAAVFGGDLSTATLQRYLELVLPTYTPASTASALADLGLSGFDPAVAEAYFADCLPQYDVRARLPDLVGRTLIVAGDSDWLTPAALVRETAAALPDAEVAILPDTGHFACNERPAMVAGRVRHWLGAA